LLEDLHDALTAIQLSLCFRIQIAAELREAASSRNCARSPLILPATCFIALICAAEPTRLTERPTGDRGTHALVEEIRLEVNLTVGNRDNVRRM
jgi:hypothetical protein